MKRNGREFSKIVLAGVMIAYGITLAFGLYIVGAKNNELLPELLVFVGAPTAVAIGFYAWKAKAENILKITKAQDEKEPEKQETIEFLNKIIEKLKEGVDDE